MPKHKTRNIFYLIIWKVNISSLLIKFGQFMSYYKRKRFVKKFYINSNLKTIVFCDCKELSTAYIGK